MDLRPYQVEALRGIARVFESGARSALVVQATGTGKTVEMHEYIRERRRVEPRSRFLYLAHTNYLVVQTARRFREALGVRVGIEMGRELAEHNAPIVCATVQSVSSRVKKGDIRFGARAFDEVIIDECHRAEGPTYRDVVAALAPRRLLGFTATPDRHDQKSLGATFAEVAARYEIQDATSDGWLVPIVEREIIVKGLTFDGVKINRMTRDYDNGEVERRMRQGSVLQQVAGPLLDQTDGRRTIVFTAGVAHAHDLAQLLNHVRPGSARAVDGTTPADVLDDAVKALGAGDIQYLLNAQLLIEGIDVPSASAVAMCRATRSRSRYVQCLGRGLRIDPATQKKDCLVLNFVPRDGISLITPVDVLGGADLDLDVRARAVELTRRGLTTSDALAKAHRDVVAVREAKEARARERKERAALVTSAASAEYQRFLNGVRNIDYAVVEVDPFSGASKATSVRTAEMTQRAPFVPPGAPEPPPDPSDLERTLADPTEVSLLVAQGVPADTYDLLELHEWKTAIEQRKRDRLPTFRMARVLLRHRLDPDMPAARATRVIDALAANQWVMSDKIRSLAL